LRVARYLPAQGELLLDAGSGPIQYPEYLEYSRGFRRRVCLDISRRALLEARRRIGDHGAFVVGDIANMPFRSGVFDAAVSLHTIHHLPSDEQRHAFEDMCRVLAPQGKAVVVYSWGDRSPLMHLFRWPIALAERAKKASWGSLPADEDRPTDGQAPRDLQKGTFTFKHDYAWVRTNLAAFPGFDVLVWRSVSPAFMRALIYRQLFGRIWLWLVFALEDLAPRLLGRLGQYPLIVFSKAE
jgi:SAM-dependent methyltransferase